VSVMIVVLAFQSLDELVYRVITTMNGQVDEKSGYKQLRLSLDVVHCIILLNGRA